LLADSEQYGSAIRVGALQLRTREKPRARQPDYVNIHLSASACCIDLHRQKTKAQQASQRSASDAG
jgi:hypothetical protein